MGNQVQASVFKIVYGVTELDVLRIAEKFMKRKISQEEFNDVLLHFGEFVAINEAVEWAAAIYCNGGE